MAKYKLSEGSLEIIMNGGSFFEPVVQILGSKKISRDDSKDRYRILLSDGRHTISFAMITTTISEKLAQRALVTNTIVKLKKYLSTNINKDQKTETKVLLIMDMDVVADGSDVGSKLGSPTQLVVTQSTANSGASAASKPEPAAATSNANGSTSLVAPSSRAVHPIISLSPYHNKWVIKVRVSNKSAIRTWSNSRGEGKLFSMDLVDDTGEIRCTAFKEMVDKFYDYIQMDKVYYVSKCQVKPANKQFTSIKNDYEMSVTNDTIFELCEEDDSMSNIPQVKYSFVPISRIGQIEVGTFVDVIGICKTSSELMTFNAKTTGRELKKKELTLVDDSKAAVQLTLWGGDAENFVDNNEPVVVVKGAKIGEYNGGKHLSLTGSSQLRLNPDLPESHTLRGWYNSEGHSMDATNISARTGSTSFQTPWMSFREVQDQGLGKNTEKGDYYQNVGTILLMRSENAIYKACATESCNKKVVDLENGSYRCEKCNREFPNFKYRLLASMNIGDWSGNQWTNMFSSEVEKILEKTSQEVGEEVERNKEAMADIAATCTFKQYLLKCRAKVETYNDEPRLKTVVIRVEPINYKEYNAYLLERIQTYRGSI